MIIVGYISNINGMASWCWETAYALQEGGEDVVLVCSKNVGIPENNKIKVIIFDHEMNKVSDSMISKVYMQLIGRISLGSFDFGPALHHHLSLQGIVPSYYIFNQPNLISLSSAIPQYVVAWAYPTGLLGYISKVGKVTNWKFGKAFLYNLLDAVGWYRKDWKGYRNATGVFAVSDRLAQDLIRKKIKAFRLYPCIAVKNFQQIDKSENTSVRIVISALNLEEPRKRIKWMLEALADIKSDIVEIHAIGGASVPFMSYFQKRLNIKFYGKLSREHALRILHNKDIFLFGSCLDDWGYVQTEAMSNGLIVMAPDLSPFDEIIGDKDFLYQYDSQHDFTHKFDRILKSNLLHSKMKNRERAYLLFSRISYYQSILPFITSK